MASRVLAIRYSPFAIRSESLGFRQRRIQILNQVIRMLQPGGEANETFADAELGTGLRRQPLMRRGGRMGDEALGVAEIVGNLGEPQAVERTERGGLAALDLEADQGRARAHLLLDGRGLRMVLAS